MMPGQGYAGGGAWREAWEGANRGSRTRRREAGLRLCARRWAASRVQPSTAACAAAPGRGRVHGDALAARAVRQARCGGAEAVRRPWVGTGVDVLCVYGPGGVWRL